MSRALPKNMVNNKNDLLIIMNTMYINGEILYSQKKKVIVGIRKKLYLIDHRTSDHLH
jgi:hypothetical protein